MEVTIIIFSFLAIFLLIISIFSSNTKKNEVNRLDKYFKGEDIIERKKEEKKSKNFKLEFISKGISNVKFLDGYKSQISTKLLKAHIFLKPEEFISINITSFSVAFFISFVLLSNVIISFVISIVAWMLPSIILDIKIKSRLKEINEQLSDAITLISNSLKAGYSFFQAVETVANEMDGPISEEFKTMQKEITLGLHTEKALENLTDRIDSDDLDLVVTAVMIQRQIGGNLSEILDNISSTIRERLKIRGEVKSLTAQGRMSGIIISILPPGLCGVLFMINREFVTVLFTDPIGIALTIFSVFLECLGIFFINKIVKIEV